MKYDNDTIQKVKEAADIYSVVNDYVTLKRAGVTYKGLCPFHNEKTPSFTISVTKQVFKCFGCDVGGDCINFIEKKEGLSFHESIKFLANKFGVYLPETKDYANVDLKDPLYTANKYISGIYEKNLHSISGKDAMYYIHSRGYSIETLQTFNVGLSFVGFSGLKTNVLSNQYNEETFEKSGLLKRSDSGIIYDAFRERIMFPIQDFMGRFLGFSGRSFKNEMPKYINTSETLIYSKSDVLYGIFQAKDSIRLLDNCYLVEGNTDVLAMHQANVKNVVASSGTAFTSNQAKLIKRFTKNVVIIFDADKAGLKATLKGIDILLSEGLNVSAISLPMNQDPDSFIKEVGKDKFKEYLENNTIDFINFKIKLFEPYFKDLNKKSDAIKSILESCNKIPDPIKRAVFIKSVASFFEIKINDSKVETEIIKIQNVIENQTPFHEIEIIKAVLIYNNIQLLIEEETYNSIQFVYSRIIDSGVLFTNEMTKSIVNLCCNAFEHGKTINPDYFFTNGTNEQKSFISELLISEESTDWEKRGIKLDSDEYLTLKSLVKNTNLVILFDAFKQRNLIKEQLNTNNHTSINIELVKKIYEFDKMILGYANILGISTLN